MIGFDYMRFDMSEKDNWKEVANAIESCDSETVLRELRQTADSRLQKVKRLNTERYLAKYKELYEGKTVLIYGTNGAKLYSVQNPLDIHIVRIISISDAMDDRFVASTSTLHIVYKDVLNTVNFGNAISISISQETNDHQSIYKSDIDHVLTEQEITECIAHAKKQALYIADNWNSENQE
jgi:hypothetical protein